MQIEVWSDFACPFCYIGKRRLEEALAEFPEGEQVKFRFNSFELNPYAPVNHDKNEYELLAEKYGKSVDEMKQMADGLRQQAAEVGLQFDFDRLVPTNTFDAHRLFQRAQQQGLGDQVAETLFKAHFEEAKHIGDRDTLTKLAIEAGMTQDDVEAAFSEDRYEKAVRTDEKEAHEIGVQGVPFFVFNDKYAMSGAQPKEVFVQGLQQILQEEQENAIKSSAKTEFCTGDECDG
ncbi:DsbA family oxidoreductase [Pontibacillus halophilus]|nr:DsbA family oxidoreductase [Pontibacillus halophilus]